MGVAMVPDLLGLIDPQVANRERAFLFDLIAIAVEPDLLSYFDTLMSDLLGDRSVLCLGFGFKQVAALF